MHVYFCILCFISALSAAENNLLNKHVTVEWMRMPQICVIINSYSLTVLIILGGFGIWKHKKKFCTKKDILNLCTTLRFRPMVHWP